MVEVRAIRSEEDYDAALARITELMNALSGPEGQVDDVDDPNRVELEVLTDLVDLYEERNYPIGFPDPISAIMFRMDQANLTPRDLVPFIGSRAKVSEVLSGKRAITMSIARALHQHLGIPAEVLLQKPEVSLPGMLSGFEYPKFPLRAMAKAGWIPHVQDLKDHAEELITGLMERAGGREFAAAPLYRKNNGRRVNAKTDDYALRAWCWQVMARARENQSGVKYRPGAVTPQLLRQVARMSVSGDGPIQTRDLLAQHGVEVEYVAHLPRTHLDGAALRLPEGRPVIGLTLRYDRIDNFWFTLLHELAHICLHLGVCSEETGFIDDHSLRGVKSVGSDTTEQEADLLAQDSLIPPEIWDAGSILEDPAPMAVLSMASAAQAHPAIVAGRVRFESGNYRLLSQFVGTGEVRRQFDDQSGHLSERENGR